MFPTASNPNQVYYDAKTGQYYTTSGTPFGPPTPDNRTKFNDYMAQGMGYNQALQLSTRNYLNGGIGGAAPGNQSMIGQRMAQRQPFQYNAPNAQSMFPGMGMPMQGTMPSQAQGNPMLGGGNFGAGRFLGQGYANSAGLLGT
jgi:hypothetical protein